MKTIIYRKGGEIYLGEHEPQKLSYYQHLAKEVYKEGYFYKGYRYYGGEKDFVVVFDNKKWDIGEMARRKENGFLGIKCYEV